MSVSIAELDAQQPFVMYCFFCFEYLSCPSMVLPRSCTNVCTPSLARKDVPFVAPVLSFFLPPKGVFQHRFGRARAVYPTCQPNSPPASKASAFRPISASNLLPSVTDLTSLLPPSTFVVLRTRSRRRALARRRVPSPCVPGSSVRPSCTFEKELPLSPPVSGHTVESFFSPSRRNSQDGIHVPGS